MTTQEMKDKGIHCRGQGLNCYNCKYKNNCVEFVECPELKQERTIICPAIYKHFKDKFYATMFISKPKDLPIYGQENYIRAYHTEENRQKRKGHGNCCLHTHPSILTEPL